MTIKLMVSDPDRLFYKEVENEFRSILILDLINGPADPEKLSKSIQEEDPELLLIGPGWDECTLKKSVGELCSNNPELTIIAAVAGGDGLSNALIDAGAKEVIRVPIESAKLLQTIQKCLKKESKHAKQEKKRKGGKIITVFSTKGGVGKTVVAINVAVGISKKEKSEVVILDLDLQFGDVGVMLKQSPKYTIYDLVSSGEDIDKTRVKSILTDYSSNLKTLLAPLQPELADLVLQKTVTPTLSALRGLADYVVIDTPPLFNDNILTVLDQSDQVILVSTMDLPSVKNIKLCLQTMKLLGYPEDKVKLILNRVEKGIGLSVEEVENSLKMKVSQTIPNDKTVLLSVNKGVPVVLEAPKSPSGISLSKLSDLLLKNKEKELLSA